MTHAPRSHPVATVVENLAPLVGVLFFGWSVAPVMVVYWVENGLKGLETAARVLLLPGSGGVEPGGLPGLGAAFRNRLLNRPAGLAPMPGADPSASPAPEPAGEGDRLPIAARVLMAGFFLVHFGIFWVGHGVFVFTLFVGSGPFGIDRPGLPGASGLPVGQIAAVGVLIASAAVASIVRDATRADDRAAPSAFALMGRAYGRMIVLHVTLILGGFGVMMLGSPTPALVLLIALKTAAELGAPHLAARTRSA